jgi:hypothetical protein
MQNHAKFSKRSKAIVHPQASDPGQQQKSDRSRLRIVSMLETVAKSTSDDTGERGFVSGQMEVNRVRVVVSRA